MQCSTQDTTVFATSAQETVFSTTVFATSAQEKTGIPFIIMRKTVFSMPQHKNLTAFSNTSPRDEDDAPHPSPSRTQECIPLPYHKTRLHSPSLTTRQGGNSHACHNTRPHFPCLCTRQDCLPHQTMKPQDQIEVAP
jgi:hypothetical protein